MRLVLFASNRYALVEYLNALLNASPPNIECGKNHRVAGALAALYAEGGPQPTASQPEGGRSRPAVALPVLLAVRPSRLFPACENDARFGLEALGFLRDPDPFDWFNKYAALKPILLDAGLLESSNILMLGCGTSTMSENMWDDGYKNITNIDFSPQCISLMQKRCADKAGMTFMVLNVLDLQELSGQTFDFIIDKGTLDCILCGENSFENMHKALTLISQLLSPGAVYLMVSYGSPVFRLNHLQKAEFGWTVELQTLDKPSLTTPELDVCMQGPSEGSPVDESAALQES
ncbi:hypothetical protein Esti_000887 [Eimeria stiedai]